VILTKRRTAQAPSRRRRASVYLSFWDYLNGLLMVWWGREQPTQERLSDDRYRRVQPFGACCPDSRLGGAEVEGSETPTPGKERSIRQGRLHLAL
jgi:hypothetical protein